MVPRLHRLRREVLLLFPLLFLLELVFGEAGQWAQIGGLSVRQVLFVLTMLSLYLYAVVDIRKHLADVREHLRPSRIDLAVFVFVVVNTIWGFVVPAIYDRSFGLAFADFGSVYVLLLYFPLAVLVRSKAVSWEHIKAVFVGATLGLALVEVALWMIGNWLPSTVTGIVEFLPELYNMYQSHTGSMSDGFFRVFFVTSIFLLPTFFLLALAVVENYRPILSTLFLFLAGCAIVVSYARGFWVSVVFGLVLAWMLFYSVRRLCGQGMHTGTAHRFLLPVLTLVAAFVFVGVTSGNVSVEKDASSPLDERITSSVDARDESNSIKLEQLPYLLEEWREAPLFGKGFGAYLEGYTRSEEAPFSYELTAPSLLMKLGLVGCALWLAPLVYVLIEGLRKADAKNHLRVSFAAAGFLAFGLAVQTNPLLFNFVGMVIVLFYLLEFALTEGDLADKVDA